MTHNPPNAADRKKRRLIGNVEAVDLALFRAGTFVRLLLQAVK